MEKEESIGYNFGLVGKNISYSFSGEYFNKKFATLGLTDHSYENFDLNTIEDFDQLIQKHKNLRGLNVTIPYKEAVIPYLHKLHPKAARIGAVNTIKVTKKGLKGYNTDAYGFKRALTPLLKNHHRKALILGTGGASKAIAFVLEELAIPFKFVSRTPGEDQLGYDHLSKPVMEAYTVLINCTPLGTFPDIERKPAIPYEYLSSFHLLFDLIYNPEKTAFLCEGAKRGATISNGLKMLEQQAEKAWKIWNS